jgi:hypothetical protein
VYRKLVTAKVYTSGSVSKYSARLYLPYRGSWRVRAYHYDADHAPSYSSYRSFRVR